MHVKVTIVGSAAAPIILEVGEYVVGRGDADTAPFPDIDLGPHDPQAKVSRRHALMRVGRSVVSIEDVGSLNGTCVNRRPRLAINTKHQLQGGDEIAIGSTFLKIEIE